PARVALLGNWPNPFNPTTTIAFELPAGMDVTLDIFDVTGRRVARLVDGYRAAGRHEARFDAGGLATGIYFSRLRAGETVTGRTMVLVR
ncbi:MAG: T9SS type A sorting domain-containing protein, partial [Synechococcaceae cyanobacterium]|nr:T9SS type A sorting domain-containing protein [Synechococcaceae cyanobacterium]